MKSSGIARSFNPIDLRCEDEIANAKSVYLVRPDLYLCVAPTVTNIGMMPLRFCQRADRRDECLRFEKVLEFVSL